GRPPQAPPPRGAWAGHPGRQRPEGQWQPYPGHPVHGAPRHGAPHPPPEEVQAARAAGLLGGLLYASGGLALLFGVLFGVGAGLMAAGELVAPVRIPRVVGTALGSLVAAAGHTLLCARA